ncbi:MAG: nucleotide pyrophosphohydrolase [Candidatus Moranbacteria bacterium]|nr:nucleotide pyrophosphohydrolase [Candidatus Moranbacteria bacterium]
MELTQLIQRAVEIREKYKGLEMKKYGKEWTNGQIAQGFIGDVGDLMKLVMTKEGIRDIENADEKIAHELADCLYSVFVLANNYGVDLEKSFLKTMDELEIRISNNDG